MTQREKVLATTMVGILFVFGGGMALHLFAYQPITQARAARDRALEQATVKQNEKLAELRQITESQKKDPRLKLWKQLSLSPANPEYKKQAMSPEERKRKHHFELTTEYTNHLYKLMGDAGFQRDVKVTGTTPGKLPSTSPGTKAAAAKPPRFDRLAFRVEATGSMDNLTKALREFHNTALLHQVRSVELKLASTNRTSPRSGAADGRGEGEQQPAAGGGRGPLGMGPGRGGGGDGGAPPWGGLGGRGGFGPAMGGGGFLGGRGGGFGPAMGGGGGGFLGGRGGGFGPQGGGREGGPGAFAMGGRGGRMGLGSGLLTVRLEVEVLKLNDAEERPSLLPGTLDFQPSILAAAPSRNYEDMTRNNTFAGYASSQMQSEERNEVLKFVKLTMIAWNPDKKRWEATFYDQAKGGPEKKVSSLWNEFAILDQYKNKVIDGKVVLLDERQLIFQADGKYHRMRCGDCLYPAISEEVDKKELVSLGITPDT